MSYQPLPAGARDVRPKYPALTPEPTPLPSLEQNLCCPACGKPYLEAWLQKGISFPKCQRPRCGVRWWAMLLEPGPVYPQLAREFSDEIAAYLVHAYHLPSDLSSRHYWQLALRPRDAFEHRETTPAVLFRAMLLLPSQ